MDDVGAKQRLELYTVQKDQTSCRSPAAGSACRVNNTAEHYGEDLPGGIALVGQDVYSFDGVMCCKVVCGRLEAGSRGRRRFCWQMMD